jgi:hypothetical protein
MEVQITGTTVDEFALNNFTYNVCMYIYMSVVMVGGNESWG